MNWRRTAGATLTLVLLFAPQMQLSAQQPGDKLREARDKYESASYEEALAVLDGLHSTEISGNEQQLIHRYRALCLIALNRLADAELPVEALIRGNPTASIDGDAPPRLRELMLRVRPRVGRTLVKEYYERGRDSYQRRDYAAAAQELNVSLALIQDESLGIAADPAFADVRMLADGFLKLASAASSSGAPASATAVDTAGPAINPNPQSGATRTQLPPAPGTTAAETSAPGLGFSPPRAVNQTVPPLPRWLPSGPGREGKIQVVIDADGLVRDAKMIKGVHPAYDQILIAAVVKNWKFEPATRNGVPVPYTLTVRVVVPPH